MERKGRRERQAGEMWVMDDDEDKKGKKKVAGMLEKK